MTGNAIIDGAATAVSIFNTILLTWLGLTVLLNSDRRAWGIWLASLGLLMGGAFFVSHTAILSLGLHIFGWNMVFWWTVGLIPAIALPFAWYVVMLWYTGFWEDRHSSLRRRQRRWFYFVVALLLFGLFGLAVGIFLIITPWDRFVGLRLFIRWSIAGVPLLALGYSAYVVLCFTLALDALRRPGPARRVMGEIARQRARPWLTAVSIVLFFVSLMVASMMAYLVRDARRQTFFEIYQDTAMVIAIFDLVVASIIAVAVVLLGQGVVSYEVFTGKTLPRRGLWRHWRRAVMLAAGYSFLVGLGMVFNLRPIYNLLLTTLLITAFYALFSWRSYRDREQYIDHLRPFVTSQRLYEQLLTHSPPTEVDITIPFRALCADILDAQVAYLAAHGPLAPLVGPTLVYPASQDAGTLPPLGKVVAQFDSPQAIISLNPVEFDGAVWAIPLWSERGLIGLFLLGPKGDGGLYSQEEIDIARVSGERLIDSKASAEMSRRLMALQRQQLSQSQVIDRQTRRVLHDDILPTLQTAMISLSGLTANDGQAAEAVDTLTDAHRQISDLLHEMPTTAAPEVARLGLVRALQKTVDGELAPAFDEVIWQLEPEAAEKCRQIPTLTAEVVLYAAREAARNAARYGRGEGRLTRPLYLTISISWQDSLLIEVEDNGVGLDTAAAATQNSGQGLALHSTMMAVIGGELTTDSTPDEYTRVILKLPVLS